MRPCTLFNSISIHAPRAGSDKVFAFKFGVPKGISIHAPRAGSDRTVVEHLLHGAISIHAPRAGSDRTVVEHLLHGAISIHATRAGSDSENSDHYPDFQIILVWLFVFGRT